MLGRSQYKKKENEGYNQADSMICNQFYYGLTNSQIANIARRLLKYIRIQLKRLDYEKMKATAIHYERLAQKDKGIPVSVEKRDDYTIISFPFNRQLFRVFHNTKGVRFDDREKVWCVSTHMAIEVLYMLEIEGANVEHAIKYLKGDREPEPSFTYAKEKQVLKISVTNATAKLVELDFPESNEIISCIQKLNRKHFDWKVKKWWINREDIPILLGHLNTLEQKVDVQDLKSYIVSEEKTKQSNESTELNKKYVIQAKQAKNRRYIAMKFPFNKEIIRVIKEMKHYQYFKDHELWRVHIMELPTLIDKLSRLENVDVRMLQHILSKQKSDTSKYHLNPAIYKHLERPPFKHQLEAASFLLKKKKAILSDEMGGGKTFSSILAAAHLPGKKLIVCPASLKLNWKKEIEMVVGDKEEIVIVNGSKWIDSDGWTILNWDIIDRHVNKIIQNNFYCGIFDEAHYGRSIDQKGNPTSRRAKAFLTITSYLAYVFLLTGTPILNYTKDIFNLLAAIDHPLSLNFHEFGVMFCGAKKNDFGWTYNGSSNEAKLYRVLQDKMLRRLKKDLLDLPEKIRSFIPVEVNLKRYEQKVEEYMSQRPYLKGEQEHLVRLNVMRHEIAKEKVKYTIEFTKELLQRGEQVVIFTNYREIVKRIMDEFGDKATKITGDCSVKQREQAKVEFQAKEKQVIVCNYQAASIGVTLTSANFMLINDFQWLPADHLQAEDRIHRIGKVGNAHIMYLYTLTAIEETVVKLLSKKIKAISKSVDGEEEDVFKRVLQAIEREYNEKMFQSSAIKI